MEWHHHVLSILGETDETEFFPHAYTHTAPDQYQVWHNPAGMLIVLKVSARRRRILNLLLGRRSRTACMPRHCASSLRSVSTERLGREVACLSFTAVDQDETRTRKKALPLTLLRRRIYCCALQSDNPRPRSAFPHCCQEI